MSYSLRSKQRAIHLQGLEHWARVRPLDEAFRYRNLGQSVDSIFIVSSQGPIQVTALDAIVIDERNVGDARSSQRFGDNGADDPRA